TKERADDPARGLPTWRRWCPWQSSVLGCLSLDRAGLPSRGRLEAQLGQIGHNDISTTVAQGSCLVRAVDADDQAIAGSLEGLNARQGILDAKRSGRRNAEQFSRMEECVGMRLAFEGETSRLDTIHVGIEQGFQAGNVQNCPRVLAR